MVTFHTNLPSVNIPAQPKKLALACSPGLPWISQVLQAKLHPSHHCLLTRITTAMEIHTRVHKLCQYIAACSAALGALYSQSHAARRAAPRSDALKP